MPKYQGHKNWNHWNVSLWINNDEGLYEMAKDCIRAFSNKEEAAQNMVDDLQGMGHTETPDGAPYTFTSVRAAMVGM